MTYDEIEIAINGLWAYDDGDTDSGIHDEMLRTKLRDHIASLEPDERRTLLSKVMRDLLTDESIAAGYGWEDARSLGAWYDEQFEVG